jgi:hypothetical protein
MGAGKMPKEWSIALINPVQKKATKRTVSIAEQFHS